MITVPLMHLTKKNVPWDFSTECQMTFETLKKAFTLTPVLTHWIPDTPIMVETDTSDYVLVAILSIQTLDGNFHPVTFHSQMFDKAKKNYNVCNKELTTIVQAFKHWHQYLEGSRTLVDVITDHHNTILLYYEDPHTTTSPLFRIPLTV